ncbi:DUF72 domain-containing protein [Ferruginibacter albus]|uniref:DUF72 domain-containing protein n=1 Tax=Ferruginibacter albus TaxID=2875540 RepID=UPI001CC74E8F|nr:DUF72 domain-containing protein [Ferruginibacter albus]UAY51223.1 DUF72 domain-containing protein [Ferruginibacter albus]
MKSNEIGILRIGTSNIVLPGNKSTFPKEFHDKSRLEYYSSLFNSVELNSTFYKVPLSSTFEKWSKEVPADFKFSVKLWKEITHAKELKFKKTDIDLFLKRIELLGDKKGCLLFQFPGKITLKYFDQVENLLKTIIDSKHSNHWNIAVEFRDVSWYVEEGFELLDEFKASMVLHDFSKIKSNRVNKQASFVFIRFHGLLGDYKGSYDDVYLEAKSKQIKEYMQGGKDVYVYFNNTIGDAFNNARTLQELSHKYFAM